MHEGLGGFRQVPLGGATEPRAIIQKGEGDRGPPDAGRGRPLEAALMKVRVPQAADVLDFITADFTWLPRPLDPIRPGAIPRGAAPGTDEPLGRRVPSEGR